MALRSKEEWTTYFRQINIPDDVSATYATIFHDNRITNEILADTTADDLRQMGIGVFGDIKTILNHAKVNRPTTTTSPDTSLPQTTATTFMKNPSCKTTSHTQ